MSKLQPVRGTHDLTGDEAQIFTELVQIARKIASNYGFKDLYTPIFEFTEVFKRTLGESSDVVSKEMYSFNDRNDESLTLRPEFTAGIARAFISNGMQQHLPLKLFSAGPLFRYERPQKGRQRQFHQINCEYLGEASYLADVEMILLAAQILDALGVLPVCTLELNTLGDAASREAHTKALVDYFSAHKTKLSEDSLMRLEKNPMRILDSKDAGDKELVADAPKMAEFLTPEAQSFFNSVQALLRDSVIAERVKVNPSIVRGLDYYSHTVFEFVATSDAIGAQSTVLAGGRYDRLIEQMGGPVTPAVGFASGIERLMLLTTHTPKQVQPIAAIALGDEYTAEALQAAQTLRQSGICCQIITHNNFGKALKKADKINASLAVIIGESEQQAQQVLVKNLQTGNQETIAKDALLSYVQSALQQQ